jgi:Family of unknown function (DUF5995)
MLLLLVAGCGGDALPERAPWAPPDTCDPGGVACIDEVVAEMTARYEPLAAECDHRAPFALMYLRVTEAVGREERTGSLRADREYLSRLDAVFAKLYFDASDAWAAGRMQAVPAAWQIAFGAAERRRASGIGDLLLGMNAHISRDLPFAVADLGLGPGHAKAFRKINAVLADVQPAILREASARFDPSIAGFELPLLEVDAASVGVLIGRWRDEALEDGRQLLRAGSPAARAAVIREIEDDAAGRAAAIVAATSRVSFSDAGKARDRSCERR